MQRQFCYGSMASHAELQTFKQSIFGPPSTGNNDFGKFYSMTTTIKFSYRYFVFVSVNGLSLMYMHRS